MGEKMSHKWLASPDRFTYKLCLALPLVLVFCTVNFKNIDYQLWQKLFLINVGWHQGVWRGGSWKGHVASQFFSYSCHFWTIMFHCSPRLWKKLYMEAGVIWKINLNEAPFALLQLQGPCIDISAVFMCSSISRHLRYRNILCGRHIFINILQRRRDLRFWYYHWVCLPCSIFSWGGYK